MLLILELAIRNLLQARRRSALLSLAIGLVTTLLVVMLSIASGIEDNLIRSATTLSTGDVNVAGFYKATVSQGAPIVTNVSSLRDVVRENTPGLDYMVERARGWAKLVSETSSTQVGLSGITLAGEDRLMDLLKLAPESDYVDGGSDELKGDIRGLGNRGSVLLFAAQARRLDVKVGDQVTVSTETSAGQTNTIDLTVVAICKDMGLLSSFSVFVNSEDVRQLYALNDDTTGAIQLHLKDIDKADEVMNHLRTVLAEKGYQLIDHQSVPFFFKFETVAGEDWTGQKLDVTTWKDETSFLGWVITAFNTITWFLIIVLVNIIMVGIVNTMWNSVRERTREIGTMRAIGMTRSRVLALILVEAAVLGLFATTGGALLGAGLALGLDAAQIGIPVQAVQAILLSDILNLVVEPGALVAGVLMLTVLTGLAAILPARHAARLRPVTAIQTID